MTIINSLELENNKIFQSDICIIGAGMAGQIIAKTTGECGIKTLILESGDENFNEDLENLNYFDIKNINQIRKNHKNRIRQIGGSANLWANRILKMSEVDFIKKKMKLKNWPIIFEEINELYNDAIKIFFENNIKLSNDEFEDNYLDNIFKKNKIFEKAQSLTPSKILNFNLKSNFTKKLISNKNIIFIKNATATNFSTKENEIIFVDVRNKYKSFKIKSKKFILAAGAIENARFLLNNEIKNKIFHNHNNGKYFMDHIRTKLGKIYSRKKIKFNKFFMYNNLDFKIQDSLVLKKNEILSNNILNSHVIFSPSYDQYSEKLFDDFIKLLKLEKLNLNFLIHPLNIIEQIYMKIPHANLNKYFLYMYSEFKKKINFSYNFSCFELLYHGEQFPNYNSMVKLSNQKDIFDQYRIKLNWNLSKEDYETVNYFKKKISELINPDNHYSFYQNKLINFEDSSHHSGTTRMGFNKNDGVVDKNCKFFGVKNLYLAGSSIFRSIGYANPGLTNAAFSLRLAKHIIKEYV